MGHTVNVPAGDRFVGHAVSVRPASGAVLALWAHFGCAPTPGLKADGKPERGRHGRPRTIVNPWNLKPAPGPRARRVGPRPRLTPALLKRVNVAMRAA